MKIFLIALLGLLGGTLTPALAQFGTGPDGQGGLIILSYAGPGGAVVIPGEINGMPVTSIGSAVFDNNESVTNVTIPESVTSIQSSAFSYCTNLTQVTIPDAVTRIGDYAFFECFGLTKVNIPAKVAMLGVDVFSDCQALTAITVSTANQNYASVDGVLFDKARTLLMVYPPARAGAYRIPDGITDIGVDAFYDCSGLTRVVITDSVTGIGVGAFATCSHLATVTMSHNLIGMGNYAFEGCDALTGLTLPGTVSSIGMDALTGCSHLQAIKVAADNLTYSSSGGLLLDKKRTSIIRYPSGSPATSYVVPKGVTKIGDDAFEGSDSLEEVTISTGVTQVGYQAFADCHGLRKVTIADSVILLADQVFIDCDGLATLTLSEGITTLGDEVFQNCTSLPGITLPAHVTSLGDEIFYGCSGLGKVTIPASVKSLGQQAFGECTHLSAVVFQGDAPLLMGAAVFSGTADGFTVEYYRQAFGFNSPFWIDESGYRWQAVDLSYATPQTITFPRLGEVTVGETAQLQASSSSGFPVTYSVLSGSASIFGSEVMFTGGGVVKLGADQSGNGVYAPAKQVRINVTVNKASQTIAFPAVRAAEVGQTVTLAATASSGLPVTYGLLEGSATISGATVTFRGAGTVKLAADQAGNGSYTAAKQVRQNVSVR